MTADDLVGWLRWADLGETEEEKGKRVAKVWAYVFPPNLDLVEKSQRESVVAYLRTLGVPTTWEGWPEPKALPTGAESAHPSALPDLLKPFVAPTPERKRWAGLIPKSSPAYRRGSLHDGTRAEVERMQTLAKGSPFDADEDARLKPEVKNEPAAKGNGPSQPGGR